MPALRTLFAAASTCLGLCLAQAADPPPLQFRRLSPREGMPAAAVHAIHQDPQGFIWFGTYDGLVRFDGTDYRVFRQDSTDPDSLIDNRVRALATDSHGQLWVATEGGLDRFDRSREVFSHSEWNALRPAYGADHYPRCFLLSRNGTLWIGTYGGGLLSLDAARRQLQPAALIGPDAGAFANAHILALCEDSQSNLWAGTVKDGLAQITPSTRTVRTWSPSPTPASTNALLSANVHAVCADRQGIVWIGTDRGLSQYDPAHSTFRSITLEPNNPSHQDPPIVDALFVDQQSHVWIGTDGQGLHEFLPDSSRFVHYRRVRYSPENLATDVIRTLYQDREGSFWIGAYPDSVYYANRLNAAFRTYRHLPGHTNTLSDESVSALLASRNGDLWVGTDKGGLNRLEKSTGTWSSYQHDTKNPTSLAANGVLALCEDHLNRLWVGTWNGGLDRLENLNGTFKRFTPDPADAQSLNSRTVWAIAEDPHHQLWIATSAGLNRLNLDTEQFSRYTHDPGNPTSLCHENVKCLLVTSSGQLWVGTRAGLNRHNPASDSWDNATTNQSTQAILDTLTVVDLLEDPQGALWIGTHNNGLYHLSLPSGTLENFRTTHGLPSDVVQSLLTDDQGYLWVATLNGLARFDPKSRSFRTYAEAHGLQGARFNYCSRTTLSNGDLLFGGTQGYTRVAPATLALNTNPPPVVFTRLEIPGLDTRPGSPLSPLPQSITETTNLHVSSRHSVIAFQFAALSYRAPDLNRFKFKLEGFDTSYRTAGRERRAVYTNLDPGRYRLHVIAANDDGVWNDAGASLNLVILPRWWQTTSFRASLALALICGLVATGWNVATHRTKTQLQEARQQHQLALERQQAAEALRESEARYRELFEHANDGISIAQDGRIITLNRHFAALCGYPMEAVLGKPLTTFVHPDDRSIVLQRHKDRITGRPGLPQAYRFRVLRQDATALWVELNTTVIQWDGQPATLNILRDISERQRAEADREQLQNQLLQAQKMESIGRLAGGVAHDFNNMLQAILGNVSLALTDTPPSSPLREPLEEAQKAAVRSSTLTRQLLAFARRQTISPKTLDLNETVASLLKMLRRLIGEHIQLVWQPGAEVWPVLIDPGQVDQLLANLALNARDAINGTGTVSIATFNTHLPSNAPGFDHTLVPGDYVALTIADTGCGMDPKTLSHIFEPFFTTKKIGEGTGLGLATVYGIVKQNGGQIRVQSDVGRGTTFTVFLPRATRHDPSPATELARRHPPRGSETILLVEDEEQVLRLATRMLEQLGYTLLTASQPSEALHLATSSPQSIHLLITDVVMPGMNGRQLRDQLLQSVPSLRCLFISGYTADVIAHQGVLDQGVEFLQKPFTLEELARRVREVLDASPLDSPDAEKKN